jgi:hypothetical protein
MTLQRTVLLLLRHLLRLLEERNLSLRALFR